LANNEKYFYIAVPTEHIQEDKCTFFAAPSTYLKVYEGDYITDIESKLSAAEERERKLLERIAELEDTTKRVWIYLNPTFPDVSSARKAIDYAMAKATAKEGERTE